MRRRSTTALCLVAIALALAGERAAAEGSNFRYEVFTNGIQPTDASGQKRLWSRTEPQ